MRIFVSPSQKKGIPLAVMVKSSMTDMADSLQDVTTVILVTGTVAQMFQMVILAPLIVTALRVW